MFFLLLMQCFFLLLMDRCSASGMTGTTTVGGATAGGGTLTPGVGTGFNGTSTGMGGSLGPTTGTMDAAAAGLLPGYFLAAAILSFLALH
jgi:hypothetical protein